jgi:hypothetical protein
MKYQVRNGYAVHSPDGKVYEEGEIFEPSEQVLADQSWKIEPVKEEEAPAEDADSKLEPEEAKEVPEPPQDRAIKKNGAQTK